MATKYWEPKALPVAQLTTVTVGGTLAGETFTITVGGVAIASHTDTDTLIATTVAALVAAWNASTHAYATGITAADASPNITLTGDTGGAVGGGAESGSPFILTLNTPGGAATFAQVETTSATSVNNFNDAVNFSDGALPGAGDTVIIADTDVNICWGLESVTATGLILKIDQSYTGLIGLRTSNFAANVSGDVYDSSAYEYRPTYLQLDIATLEIGGNKGYGAPVGSNRIKIDNDRAGSSTTTIFNTSESSADDNLLAVRLLLNHAGANVYCDLTGAGGAGIGVDAPGETSTISKLTIRGASTRFVAGYGVGITTVVHYDGTTEIYTGVASITLGTRYGGQITYSEDTTITTYGDYNAGQTIGNGVISQLYIREGGTVDSTQSNKSRTWLYVFCVNGTLRLDTDVLTITNLDMTYGQGLTEISNTDIVSS